MYHSPDLVGTFTRVSLWSLSPLVSRPFPMLCAVELRAQRGGCENPARACQNQEEPDLLHFLRMFSELLNDEVAINHIALLVTRVPEEANHPPLGQNGHTKSCRWIPDDISWARGPVWELGFSGFTALLFMFSFVVCMPLSTNHRCPAGRPQNVRWYL